MGSGERHDPGRDRRLIAFIKQLNLRLASNLEPDAILGGMVEDTVALLGADEGCIRMVGPEDRTGHTVVRKAVQSGSWPRPVAEAVVGFLSLSGSYLATRDLEHDPRFPGMRDMNTRIRAVLAVPLMFDRRLAGLLAVSCVGPGHDWSDDEIQQLSMVASYSAEPLIRAQRRYEEHRAMELEQEITELKFAQEVQLGLVPSRPLVVGDWEVRGRVVPARRVGGDLFHYFPIASGALGLALADVEGKGLPAALTMAMVRGALGEICRSRPSVPEALNHVSRALSGVERPTRMTMFYGEFDVERRVLHYSCAGHPPSLVCCRGGRIEALPEGGPLFGVFARFDYPVGKIHLDPGDALLAYSDGVTEALSPSKEFFGEERLHAAWASCSGRTPADSIDLILRGVEGFRATAEQSDDITLMVLGTAGRLGADQG